MIKENKFKMKVYDFSAFMKDFLVFHKDIPALIKSLLRKKISPALESKMMLAVTSVNRCRYCSWYHSRAALKAGVKQSEVNRLLSGQLDLSIGDKELTALNFAVHYAETNEKPDPKLLNNLFEVYGKKVAAGIMVKLRLIYFGNLCGNTFRAFLSRMKGVKPEDSFWLTELIIFVIILPLFGPLVLNMKRKDRFPSGIAEKQ